jgi:hypothetical protein
MNSQKLTIVSFRAKRSGVEESLIVYRVFG